MGHALEVRSPFLDVELAEFAFSLPFDFKQHGSSRKRILCDAYRDMLPKEIFDRPKMGFGLPVASCLCPRERSTACGSSRLGLLRRQDVRGRALHKNGDEDTRPSRALPPR